MDHSSGHDQGRQLTDVADNLRFHKALAMVCGVALLGFIISFNAAGNDAAEVARTVSVVDDTFACTPASIGLSIENEIDSNGNWSVVDGTRVNVAWVANDKKLLSKKDTILLVRVSDNSIVSSAVRGKGNSGSVSLKVKKSAGEELYVLYNARKSDISPCAIPNLLDPNHTPLVSIPGADVSGLTIRLNALETAPPEVYAVGDVGPAGGWVIKVTDGGLHGLEAAPASSLEQFYFRWGCWGTNIDGAEGAEGGQNTGDILAWCMDADIAARVAANYWLNGFDDWYLPTKNELQLMHQHFGAQTGNQASPNQWGFRYSYYWSSNESTNPLGGDTDARTHVFVQLMNTNTVNINVTNKNFSALVRPVRKF